MARDFISDIVAQDFPLYYAFDFDKETSPKQGVFLAKDGLYERTSQPHFDMLYKTNSFSTRAGNGSLTPYVDPVAEMPRVPIEIVATIFAFFREIYAKAKTEVQINVYWNRDHKEIPDVPGMKNWGNDIYTYVPRQRVSTARTTFDGDETYLWMIKNTVILLDTHSHHDMSAFMSGTDQSSSNIPAVYFDMGKITSKNAQIFAWCAIDDQHIFEDLPLSELYKFMEPLPEPVKEPVKTWDRVGNSWKTDLKTPASKVKSSFGTVIKESANLFDSEALLKLAIDVPKDWGEQVILPVYKPATTYTGGLAKALTPTPQYFGEDDFGLSMDFAQGALWDGIPGFEGWSYPSQIVDPKADALEIEEDQLMQELEITGLTSSIIEYPEWAINKGLVERFYDIVNLTTREELETILQTRFGSEISLKDCKIITIQSGLSQELCLFENEILSGEITTLADITDDEFKLIDEINQYVLNDKEGIVRSNVWFDIIDVLGEENAFRLESALIHGDLDVWFNDTPTGHAHVLKEGHRMIRHEIFTGLDLSVSMSQPLIDILNLKTKA